MEITRFIVNARDGRLLVYDDESRVDWLEGTSAAVGSGQVGFATMSTHHHAAAVGRRSEQKDALEAAVRDYERSLRERMWLPGALFGPTIVKAVPIDDAAGLAKELTYLHLNPMKTTPPLVEVPWEFPWTSAREHLRLSCAERVNLALAREVLGSRADRYERPVALADLKPIARIGEAAPFVLAAAAQAFGLTPTSLSSRRVTPQLVRARAAFPQLGLLEGYRQRQLGPLIGRSPAQTSRLVALPRNDEAVQIVRTLLREPRLRRTLREPASPWQEDETPDCTPPHS